MLAGKLFGAAAEERAAASRAERPAARSDTGWRQPAAGVSAGTPFAGAVDVARTDVCCSANWFSTLSKVFDDVYAAHGTGPVM